MTDSLKNSLFNFVKGRGYMTRQEMFGICADLGHAQSNGERRMRELRDLIEEVKNEKGRITAYRWKGFTRTVIAQPFAPKEPTTSHLL